MQPGSKLFGGNLADTLPNVEMRTKEQQDSDRKGRESLDNLIRQTIGKEPFFSFTKTGDSPLQWIHWLDSWDQQNGSITPTSQKLDSGTDVKSNKQAESSGSDSISGNTNGVKDSAHSSMKNGGAFGRGIQGSGDRLHSLKIPEAVVAFAQAAAKANDLSGWPLVPPPKTQLQKCEKCVLEFCSPLNYRRHIRMHRRPLNVKKEDLRKVRPQVAAFWDKLTVDEAGEIVSHNNMMLEDLSGSSLVKALAGFLQQPASSFFHQSYLKAGTTLLEIVQNKLSKSPLTSEELFNVLDDASEKTFLCGVLSVSMKRFIFEGEAGKVGLEARNLIAVLGFLVEQRLIKSWMAERDEEALRCQKALVEEEEAAQRKRAKLQERKRLKKIRQKELKDKESKGTESGLKGLKIDPVDKGNIPNHEVDDSPSAKQSSSSAFSGQYHQQESCTMELDGFGEPLNMSFKSEAQETAQVVNEQQALGLTNIVGFKSENRTELETTSSWSAVQASIQETQVYQSDENVKLFVPGKTTTVGSYISEQRINHAWRERRREFYESSNYQRPFYGSERRVFDAKYRQAERTARKPYNTTLAESHEYPSISSVNEPYITRSRHYHDRSLGVRKHAATVHGTHVVWARKVQQNAILEPSKVDTLDEASKTGEAAVVNISVQHNEKSHMEDKSIHAINEQISCIGRDSSNVATGNLNTWCTNCEKLDRASTPDKPDLCLSCDSSISFDCSSCQSSVSILEKVGAEKEAQDKEVGQMGPESDVYETRRLSWESVEDQTEVNSSNGALFIGSLSIPLQVFSNLKCEGNPYEKLKRSSKDLQHSPGKKQKGETATFVGSPCLDAGREKKRSQRKVMVSACEVSEEGNSKNKIAFLGQLYHCKDVTDLSETDVSEKNTVFDRAKDEVSLGSGAGSTATLWQPGSGSEEQHQVHVNESYRTPARNEDLPLVPVINRTADDSSHTCTLKLVKDVKMKPSGCASSSKSSIEDQQEEHGVKTCKGQLSNVSREAGFSAEHETPALMSLKLNNGSLDASMDLKHTDKMLLAAIDKWESLSRCVAAFLSRRWIEAIAGFEG